MEIELEVEELSCELGDEEKGYFYIYFYIEDEYELFDMELIAKVNHHLLKAVKNQPGKEESQRHFRDFITQEFRKNIELSDLSSIQQKIRLAHDYTFLLNSVHHHKDLLFSYNIAVDRSDEMKRTLGKSAASVGLQLPDV
ncbi:hypothetical protein L1049_010954 [Liquidambar formosana]|uniref:Uncharacterized protein n=1 Tax=Liquidambar formosana TaxID=63359 RepID=A0AAP0RQQ6_LIQFO